QYHDAGLLYDGRRGDRHYHRADAARNGQEAAARLPADGGQHQGSPPSGEKTAAAPQGASSGRNQRLLTLPRLNTGPPTYRRPFYWPPGRKSRPSEAPLRQSPT